MFRGYKCKHKKAAVILETLGFDPKVNRGWVILRKPQKGRPCQMHAMIHRDDDGTEYIDVHSDFEQNGKHISKRGRRTERWNELFGQIDHGLPCDAGHKLLAHYIGLKAAVTTYHEKRQIE